MRNPRRTFRKPSRKPLSKKKLRRYNGYDKLDDEELFEAQLALQKWFHEYMEGLHNAQRDESAGLASIRRATR